MAEIAFADEFERALRADDPVAALRSLALSFADRGYKRQEVYNLFLPFYKFLQREDRGHDEDLLGDVMDMITGFCGPSYKLDLPD
jgi:hypothetical protein